MRSSDRLDINWKSPGPVSDRFMASTASVQIINGPIGSGKTTTNFMKHIELARRQMPSRTRTIDIGDGNRPVRKYKLCVVRDTYRQLHKTTLPSWHKRFPADLGEWHGAMDAPCRHRLHFLLPDGTVADFIAEFAAIGETAVEDFMRGFEPTSFLLNELDLLSKDVLTFARGRAGRYPDMSEGGPSWYGVTADCNAPEFESWLYQDIFQKSPADLAAEDTALFMQPGGLDIGAENHDNLPPRYYATQMHGQPEWYIQRMIHNRPGYSRAGKPIFPEFKDAFHVAPRDLEPIPGLPLVIGIDPRTNPSAVFMQRLLGSGRRVVDEIQGEINMGPKRFAGLVNQKLHDVFPYIKPESIKAIVDPTSQYGADKEGDEKPWLEIFEHETGIRLTPAHTNKTGARREALRKTLTEVIEGSPAMLISPRARILRTALNTGYRFRKLAVGGAERFGEEAEKNNFADMAEACEYACLGDDAYAEVLERKTFTSAAMRAARAEGERSWNYDPLSLDR